MKSLNPVIASIAFAALASAQQVQQDPPAPAVQIAVAPIFPVMAALSATAGVVEVEARLSGDGHVKNVRVLNGHKILRESALAGARRWRFASGSEGLTVKLTFVYRIMPKGSSQAELVTTFQPPYLVEVRRVVPDLEGNSDPDPDSQGKGGRAP